MAGSTIAADSTRFAHSDSESRYVHWIDLYDTSNRKITPASTLPYSPQNTCGRCHDYEAISHGWHFDAFAAESKQGRPSEPWVWTDARTGTQLPLSYREQDASRNSVFHPAKVALSPWQMTSQFGARFPGGSFGEAAKTSRTLEPGAETVIEPLTEDVPLSPRWAFTGSLEVDCMVCHASPGDYDFETRRSQISDENFAWAPTAAMHLASIDGKASRIKDDADADDDKTIVAMPKVSYDEGRFAPDGKVFFDLVRQPDNNSCFQCHSSRQVSDGKIEARWMHDEDVHLRAGMMCVDCHRNGIEHETVRGYQGQSHPSGVSVETLSCSGCHLGSESSMSGASSLDVAARAGRLGSPRPQHAGLPPIHFERLACTACHSGPAPRDEAIRMMTSLAHSLGASDHRTGAELPQIQGSVFVKLDDGRIYPQRVMWPAFWGTIEGDSIQPRSPADVYDWTRKSLRVRKDFIEEIANDKAKFDEKVLEALSAIENESGAERAVYVAAGQVHGKVKSESGVESLAVLATSFSESEMVAWPTAHNVRPAGWSLGVGGCVECHSEGGKVFSSTVTPLGPSPNISQPIAMASLQGIDVNQRLLWNQLFAGRTNFKVMVAVSLAVLLAVLLAGLGSAATILTTRRSTRLEKRS